MFVFRKIWRALFSCYIRFEIRFFDFLPTSSSGPLFGRQIYITRSTKKYGLRNESLIDKISRRKNQNANVHEHTSPSSNSFPKISVTRVSTCSPSCNL